MRVTIRDKAVFAALRPQAVAAYLKSKGWRKVGERPDHSSTWLYDDPAGEQFEIALPLNTGFRDLALRMSDILRTLEVVEDRSQLDLLRDLQKIPNE